jgi:undecaprenyl-diphosphatase
VPDLTYLQAVVMGLLQGVTELFPISSLGHSILLPAWLGGSWASLVTQGDSAGHTPFLAFVVALHVATAVALIVYYWRDWVLVIRGFFTSLRHRDLKAPGSRLAWLIIVGTIPVGIVGVIADKPLRVLFATPLVAAIFLTANGLVLLAAELLRRRQQVVAARAAKDAGTRGDVRRTASRRIDDLRLGEGAVIGTAQILALLPGISRSGVTISAGLLRRLDHESAARFAFMLATPVILAAGVLKIPDLLGPSGHGILGQVLVGSVCAFVAAFAAVAFLSRWFHTRTLYPFVIYCLIAGIVSIVRFA